MDGVLCTQYRYDMVSISKLAALIGFVVVIAWEAVACSCAPCGEKPLTDNEYVDTVFAAEVIGVRQTSWWEDQWTYWFYPPWEDDRLVYTLRTIEVVQGKLGKKVEVRTSEFPAACGARFGIFETVGIAASRRSDGVLRTSTCLQRCWQEAVNKDLLSVDIENFRN